MWWRMTMARVVVVIGGDEVQVPGRAGEMIRFLASNWERVNVAEKGDVTFNFARAEITPKVYAIDPQLRVPGEPRRGSRRLDVP